MTPYYADASITVHVGDCRAVMAEMEPASVHCVVTSPPYWGLRDYGVAGQLGLEPTPDEYVANMVDVFRAVRRVLRDDGTVWLNLGDSYATGTATPSKPSAANDVGYWNNADKIGRSRIDGREFGLKPKDLVGIPWMVAFALRADGWYLRSDIIWAKPNPMPESVTDRPTKAHEYVFLLSKAPRYYFDADAVREAESGQQGGNVQAASQKWGQGSDYGPSLRTTLKQPTGTRNLRSVWTIATQPYPGAHFATFPEKLVEPCVKAGTSAGGVCRLCGKPWERVVDRPQPPKEMREAAPADKMAYHTRAVAGGGGAIDRWYKDNPGSTTGWREACDCTCVPGLPGERVLAEPVPATCLDPFAGSGTVGRVANRLARRAVLIDLSADYIDQAMVRNAQAGLGLGA